jgi:outer membrane protein assembly factor BamB
VRDQLAEAWTAEIGAGGGYRRRLTARPVIGGGRVFVMDSDAVISAFDARHGNRLWRVETSLEDEDSTNVGGGIALDGPTLYAATGLASVLAIEASSGKGRWRQKLPTPARAAPTIAEDRLYIPTLDEQVLALAKTDGKRIWSYQGPETQTAVLGLPSPAYADGLLVAGFGTGELVCLSAASGAVSWSDGLASARGLASPVDLSSIPGLPVISQGQVYAVGLGGLFVALDLRSGRRLWEREVASEQTPWLAGDWLFVLTPDQVLGAINRQDGTVAWVSQLPLFQDEKAKEDPITWVGPVLAGDRLIVAGSSKEALAVSPYTGAVLGRQELRGKATLAPVVAGGTVFLITDDATLLALR